MGSNKLKSIFDNSIKQLTKEKDLVSIDVRNGKELWDDISYGYGTDWVELTDEDMKNLQQGKILQMPQNASEYQMFMRVKK